MVGSHGVSRACGVAGTPSTGGFSGRFGLKKVYIESLDRRPVLWSNPPQAYTPLRLTSRTISFTSGSQHTCVKRNARAVVRLGLRNSLSSRLLLVFLQRRPNGDICAGFAAQCALPRHESRLADNNRVLTGT